MLTAALYNALARSAWGICVAWVIVACVTGWGGRASLYFACTGRRSDNVVMECVSLKLIIQRVLFTAFIKKTVSYMSAPLSRHESQTNSF